MTRGSGVVLDENLRLWIEKCNVDEYEELVFVKMSLDNEVAFGIRR